MKKILLLIGLLLFSHNVFAQGVVIEGLLQTKCVEGCSGGTTDTDDGSVAGGQSTGINLTFLHLWDGSVWRRAPGDSTNGLTVTCTNCGGSTFSDNSAFTFGTTTILNTGYVFDDVAPNAVTENRSATPRMSSNRVPYSIIRDAAGNERGVNVNASNQLSVSVDNSITIANTAFGITQTGANNDIDILTIAAGDNNIGNVDIITLPSIPAGTNNIGDIDVLSIAAGDNNIGNVDIVSLPSVTIGTFPDNEPFNLNQLAGNGVSTGVGASGTGTLRTASLIHDGTDTALVSGSGSLQVTCDNCGGSTFADNAAFTFGTSTINNVGFVLDDTATNAATENSAAAARISSNRMQLFQLGDGAGNERRANVTAGNALVVDGSGVTQPVSNAGLTELAAAIDTELQVDVVGALPAGTNNIGDVDILTIAAGDNNIGNVDVVTLPSITIGTFPDNEPFNLNQVGGGAVSTIATGVLEVGISDSNGASFLSAANALNSTGAGIQAAQIIGQFDDTSPTTITENQFGNLRMSTNRNLFGTIRDAAGNERGANVNASNALLTAQTGELPAGTQNIGDVDIASLPNEGEQTAANSISVTLSTDNDPIGPTGSAVPGEAVLIGGTDGTNLRSLFIDPCSREAKTTFVVNISTASTTEIANQVASEFFYVCSINLVTAAANNVILVEDDTDACASPTAGLNGGTTTASGWNFAANSGIVAGDGAHYIMKTATANRYFCIITSAATQLSGTITYVSDP